MPEELWTEVHDIIQEKGIKTVPKKKKYRKAKWLSEEALQIAEKKRSERQRRNGKIYHLNVEFQKNIYFCFMTVPKSLISVLTIW